MQSRFVFIGREIRTAIEDSLGVGLTLAQLRSTQDVIERMKLQDADIRSVEVFDQDGLILFSTDRAGIGELVPTAWMKANRQAKANEPWRWSDSEGHVVGMAVHNSLGLIEGGVSVSYSPAILDAKVEAMFIRLAGFTGELLAAFAVLTVLGVTLVLGLSRQKLRQLEAALCTTLESDGRRAVEPGDWQFERSIADFQGKAREVMDAIAEAQRQVELLDRDAK